MCKIFLPDFQKQMFLKSNFFGARRNLLTKNKLEEILRKRSSETGFANLQCQNKNYLEL